MWWTKPKKEKCKHEESKRWWDRKKKEFMEREDIEQKFNIGDQVKVKGFPRRWFIDGVVYDRLESETDWCVECDSKVHYFIDKPIKKFTGLYSAETFIDSDDFKNLGAVSKTIHQRYFEKY